MSQADFDKAADFVRKLPSDGAYKPTDETKLKFYGYYKQATVGPCNTSKPGILDLFAKKKWESWNGLGNMSKEEAMKHYVEEINKVRKEYEAATKK